MREEMRLVFMEISAARPLTAPTSGCPWAAVLPVTASSS